MKKILIIEDESDLREMEKENLQTAGYKVFEAGNAKDGVELAVKERPDVILMDIRLPYKKRGIGAAKMLRNTEETKDTPIIFVTGYPMWEQSAEVKNIANCAYITKPFDIRTLITQIERSTAK